MKKSTLFGALILSLNFAYGQSTVNFESISLSPESYDNGSGGAGDFVIGDLTFTNVYNSSWGSWNGFSISNTTDVTTFDYSNQYSAAPGVGSAGSANYAVYFPEGSIVNNGSTSITGFEISNSALARLSMLNGDAIAKQFGSPNDAYGNPDGTNGEDYLRVWIVGADASGSTKDSLLFYLADYRFSDNNLDYIVDTWEQIDLTSFGFAVKQVSFRFESSDVGQWGINTPTFLAIDNVQLSAPLGVEQLENAISVYPNPVLDKLVVEGVQDAGYTLMDQQGRVLVSGTEAAIERFSFDGLTHGMYTLVISYEEQTVVKRLVH